MYKQKTALLLHLGGKDLRQIYKTVKAETDTYNDVKQKLSRYFNPKKNVTYERFIFKSASQEVGESCSSYITRLKTLAETCDFEGNNEIRDHFVFTCRLTTLKKKLLQQENLTLEKLLFKFIYIFVNKMLKVKYKAKNKSQNKYIQSKIFYTKSHSMLFNLRSSPSCWFLARKGTRDPLIHKITDLRISKDICRVT